MFAKTSSPSALHELFEQGRASPASSRISRSAELDVPNRHRSCSSPCENERSSDSRGSDPSFKSSRSGQSRKRRRGSVSQSPEWTGSAYAQAEDLVKKLGQGRPPKKKLKEAETRSKTQQGSRPTADMALLAYDGGVSTSTSLAVLWSADEEAMLLDVVLANPRMSPQNIRDSFFPFRSVGSVRNKRLKLRKIIKHSEGTPSKQEHQPYTPSTETESYERGADGAIAVEELSQTRGRSDSWSAAEDQVIQDKMQAQKRNNGRKSFGKDAVDSKLMSQLPDRSYEAIRHRWDKWRITWDEWAGKPGKIQDGPSESSIRVKKSIVDGSSEECSNSPTAHGDDSYSETKGSRKATARQRQMSTWITNKWTPGEDQLLKDQLQSYMQSTGRSTLQDMRMPQDAIKRLSNELGRDYKAVSRRLSLLRGLSTWNGKEKNKRTNIKKSGSNRSTGTLREEATVSSPRLVDHVVQETSRRRQPAMNSRVWSTEEIETLVKLTKGMGKTVVRETDFKEIAAQMPGPRIRTANSCRIYWKRNIQWERKLRPRRPSEPREVTVGTSSLSFPLISNRSGRYDCCR